MFERFRARLGRARAGSQGRAAAVPPAPERGAARTSGVPPQAPSLQVPSPQVPSPQTPSLGGTARGEARVAPGEAFTPTRPSVGRRQIVGRQEELESILLALRDEKAHVVLYAERGSGKTSLANLVTEVLRRSGAIVARHTCEASSSFDAVTRGLLRSLPEALLAVPAEGGSGEGCEAALPPGEIQPRHVTTLLSRLTCRSLVCVVDEFDRVEDSATRLRLADTIKQISDCGAALSLMVVGVSGTLDELLGYHPSIQRNVVPFHLPLLRDGDITGLLVRGGEAIGLTFPPVLIAQMTLIARGMPYMAQLLGLRVAQKGYLRGEARVTEADFIAVVEKLLVDARPSVAARYVSLTDGGQDAEMAAALRRIATASHDPWGRLPVAFGPGAVAVGDQDIAARCWTRLQAADVLRPSDTAGLGLVTFNDRSLLTHVLLLAARDGTLLDGYGQRRLAPGNADTRRFHPAAFGG